MQSADYCWVSGAPTFRLPVILL